MITSEIIADSFNPVGNRLTTFILEYPRYIHSEVMTHRVFSKNAASSRAIPVEKMIKQIQDNPAMPTHWGKNQSGMSANEELDNIIRKHDSLIHELQVIDHKYTDLEQAKNLWLIARDAAILLVEKLNTIGLHKQIANRILEPWFHIRIIMTGTEFENFFALRAHKDAHPDLQKLAYLMLDQYNSSEPKYLKEGEWHIPFGDKMDEQRISPLAHKLAETYEGNIRGFLPHFRQAYEEIKKKIAVSRCARISYLNYEGKDDYDADIKLCDRLFGSNPKHLSPTEHVAQAMNNSDWSGNFRGFKQFRKFFKEENLTDPRVIKKFNPNH